MPQIIETAIYEAYKDKGWDIATNRNYKYKCPFKKGVASFPTISDVIKKVDEVVETQGFDERLKNDYIGSIKARLQGLTIGSKGFMLNTDRSFNFERLLEKKVVIELEEIKSPSEKAFIIGIILINLNEALKRKYKVYKQKNEEFRHITLIEEAHRLLSKFEIGDSLNKKNAIEAFSDMLAEVRKYGESLIIIDQIPNKLTPEVLKNTNTKIVHRIFAKDDKETIGNTMALSEEQKEFLSKLDVGRAIIFNQDFFNPIQVQIEPIKLDEKKVYVKESEIKSKWQKFYEDEFQIKIDDELLFFDSFWQNFTNTLFSKNYENEVKRLHFALQNVDSEKIANFLSERFYEGKKKEALKEYLELIKKDEAEKVGFLIKKLRRM